MATNAATPTRFFFVKGGRYNKKRLLMTRKLLLTEAVEEAMGRLLEAGSFSLYEVHQDEIPKRFSAGIKMVENQSFTICIAQMYNNNTGICLRWVTTSREKKGMHISP